jgi:peptide/nickel transport system substrate-binding protein
LQGDFQAAVSYWSERIDPDGNIYSFLHTGSLLNEGHYSNGSVDSLLDQARQVMNVDDRRAIYGTLWQQEVHDLPITYLWTWKNIVGLSAKVEGFVPIPDGLIRVQGISVTR